MANVKLTDEERREIGREIRDLIDAGTTAKGSMSDWWETVEKAYRNELPDGVDMFGNQPTDPQYYTFHVPFSQPRQDALTSQVCTVLAKQDPYMVVRPDKAVDPDRKKDAETELHKQWEKSGFETILPALSTIATNTNKAILKVVPTYDADQCCEFHTYHPKDFVRVPDYVIPGQVSKFAGVRFYLRHQVIVDKIRAGDYYGSVKEGETTGPDIPEGTASISENDVTRARLHAQTQDWPATANDADGPIQMWEGILLKSLDGNRERLYRVSFAFERTMLMSMEEYEYSDDWFCEFYYVTDESGYWPGRSVGRNLAGLQDIYNKLNAALYRGSMMAGSPPVIGPKLESATQYKSYNAGDYVESDEPEKPYSPTITFQGQYLVLQIQNLEHIGDRVARISQQMQGASPVQKETATATSIMAQGAAVGVEEYLRSFSSSLPKLARLTAQFINENIKLHHLNQNPIEQDYVWQPSGQDPQNNPMARAAAAQQLIALVQLPDTGLNAYDVAKAIVDNSPLGNISGIQKSREDMASGLDGLMKTIKQMIASGIPAQEIAGLLANDIATHQQGGQNDGTNPQSVVGQPGGGGVPQLPSGPQGGQAGLPPQGQPQ